MQDLDGYTEQDAVATSEIARDGCEQLRTHIEAMENDHRALRLEYEQASRACDEARQKLDKLRRAYEEAQDEIRGLRHALTSQVNQVGMLTEVLHRVTKPE